MAKVIGLSADAAIAKIHEGYALLKAEPNTSTEPTAAENLIELAERFEATPTGERLAALAEQAQNES
jgi:hypothetical protein